MIEFYKHRGETPLEALDRLRIEKPLLKNEVLSYAGRLDPMAEGILPVLVGKEENQNRQEFLHKDKEYVARFMLGCSTDSGDVLGVVQRYEQKKISQDSIVKTFNDLVLLQEQTYPWYSSKTVNGIPLFKYAQQKDFSINRPTRKVTIYSVKEISSMEKSYEEIRKSIIEDIQKVKGDFRQAEILDSWNHTELGNTVQLVSCRIQVSSGTYIRALTEILEKELNIPVVLYTLVRTRVF